MGDVCVDFFVATSASPLTDEEDGRVSDLQSYVLNLLLTQVNRFVCPVTWSMEISLLMDT